MEKYYTEHNFIVQEIARQSAYISQFCPTSINTLRIQLYRSVVDNEVYIPNMILRIGKNGALVDNAHAGGSFVGIESDGHFQKYVCNQYGNKQSTFNNIDFANNDYVLPNYDEIIRFAKNIGKQIHHARLIALDLILDENNSPKLIEFNVSAFSLWLFQYTTGTAFGRWTDEIMEYVIKNKRQATHVHIEL